MTSRPHFEVTPSVISGWPLRNCARGKNSEHRGKHPVAARPGSNRKSAISPLVGKRSDEADAVHAVECYRNRAESCAPELVAQGVAHGQQQPAANEQRPAAGEIAPHVAAARAKTAATTGIRKDTSRKSRESGTGIDGIRHGIVCRMAVPTASLRPPTGSVLGCCGSAS